MTVPQRHSRRASAPDVAAWVWDSLSATDRRRRAERQARELRQLVLERRAQAAQATERPEDLTA
ncbi:hypothetical protein BH10ACT3_BH10ACT3_03230 [soil metagenome]